MALLCSLNLSGFPARGVSTDTAMNGTDALRVLAGQGPQMFFPANGGREGAFIDLVALSFRVFGVGIWQLRLPSVIFGVLFVVLLGILGRRLLGAGAGLAAAFLAATSPGMVMLSRSGYRASVVPALACLALLSVLWARDGEGWARWAVAGVVAGLAFNSYTAWPAVPVALGLWLLLEACRRRVRWRDLLTWSGWTVLAALPLLAAKHLAGGEARTGLLVSSLTPGNLMRGLFLEIRMPVFGGDVDWRYNISGMPLLPLLGGILLLLGAFLLFRHRRSLRYNAAMVLGILFLLGTLTAALSTLSELPMYLRSTPMFPAVFLAAGYGFAIAEEWVSARRGRPSGLVPLVLASGAAVLVISLAAAGSPANRPEINFRYQVLNWSSGTAVRSGGSDRVLILNAGSSVPAAAFTLAAWPHAVQTLLWSPTAISAGDRVFCDEYLYNYLAGTDAGRRDTPNDALYARYGLLRDSAGYLYRPSGRNLPTATTP